MFHSAHTLLVGHPHRLAFRALIAKSVALLPTGATLTATTLEQPRVCGIVRVALRAMRLHTVTRSRTLCQRPQTPLLTSKGQRVRICAPSTITPPSAGTAQPRATKDSGVFRRVRMSVRTHSLGDVRGGNRLAAQQVRPSGHGFEVVRSNTRTVAAQMIEIESFWNTSHELLVGKPVGRNGLARTELELSITLIEPCGPLPAVRPLVHLRPEAIFGGGAHTRTGYNGATVAWDLLV